MTLPFVIIPQPKPRKGARLLSELTPKQQRYRAANILGLAKTLGRVIPRPCCVCREAKAVAHHEDYLQPYIITFLCAKHHVHRHIELRSGAQSQITEKLIARASKHHVQSAA